MNDEARIGERFDGMSLPELAGELLKLQTEKDDIKARSSFLQQEIDVLTMSIIPEMMADEEIETMTIAGVGRLQTKTDAWVNVRAADREAFYTWLRENGHGSLIKPTVAAQTLKAWAKAQVKEGNEMPDQVKFEPYEKAALVKS